MPIDCTICKKKIIGSYQVDSWGNKYHQSHLQEFHQCTYCQRLICAPLTAGGTRYPDGRVICNLCLKTAVRTPRDTQEPVLLTRDLFRRFGLSLQDIPTPVELLDEHNLLKLIGYRKNPHVLGLMSCQEINRTGKAKTTSFKILILYGLPRIRFIGVMAHELTHVWIKLNCRELSTLENEGLPELMSYLVLNSLLHPEANFLKNLLARNEDPVYGKGLAKARRCLETMGLKKYLETLKRK